MKNLKLFALLALVAIATACGGGGGVSEPTPVTTPTPAPVMGVKTEFVTPEHGSVLPYNKDSGARVRMAVTVTGTHVGLISVRTAFSVDGVTELLNGASLIHNSQMEAGQPGTWTLTNAPGLGYEGSETPTRTIFIISTLVLYPSGVEGVGTAIALASPDVKPWTFDWEKK